METSLGIRPTPFGGSAKRLPRSSCSTRLELWLDECLKVVFDSGLRRSAGGAQLRGELGRLLVESGAGGATNRRRERRLGLEECDQTACEALHPSAAAKGKRLAADERGSLHVARESWHSARLGVVPHFGRPIGGTQTLELLIVHGGDSEDGKLEARHERVGICVSGLRR
eukprot:scaffold16086_cov33-Tisochrysis_lutea.AAC.4